MAVRLGVSVGFPAGLAPRLWSPAAWAKEASPKKPNIR